MRESLIGDIEEAFARGRSSFWYWRQVVPAIVSGLRGDLQERPVAVIGAVVITSAATALWVELTTSFYVLLWDSVYPWIESSVVFMVFWVPFGGGTPLLWCVGSAVVARIGAWWADNNIAALAGMLLAQVTLSLWLTRDFWLYGAFTTHVSAKLWVANYAWATLVLIGLPISAVIGFFWGTARPRDLAA